MRRSLPQNPWSLILLLVLVSSPVAGGDLRPALADVDTGTISILEARQAGDVLEVVLDRGALNLAGLDQKREDLIRDLLWAARAQAPELAGIRVRVQIAPGQRVPLAEALGDRAAAARARADHHPRPAPPRPAPPIDLPYGGSLEGRTIALSPGHGLTWYDTLNDWSYQRGLINMPDCESCLGIIEDLSNNQIAVRYLIPHLIRAGADVWTVRERDFSSFETIVDDGDAGVIESGPWSDGSSAGGYGDDYRVLLAGEGGAVDYPIEPEQEGVYWISVWYVAGQNRIAQAEYHIHHLGGTTVHRLDQREDGSRWISLGAYRFAPGAGGRVEIRPGPDAAPDAYLIADGIRAGGGIDHSLVNGKPAAHLRWQMSAHFHQIFAGLPDAVHTGSDVTVRPAWAEWQGADVYLSLHSNASGGSTSAASGTSTYRFSCYDYPDHSTAPDPSLCDDPPGSDALQRAIHGAMIEFLRAEWDPAWRDRGRLVANFGEVRVLDQIPGALVESAFHDGTSPASTDMRMADNQALQDPRFRYWLGYALYAGLVRYFDPGATLLPARPPEGVYLTQTPDQGLRVGWQPVAGAAGYRIRWAVGNLGFGPEAHTEETHFVLPDLSPGDSLAVRVSALNAGGEGPPSEWLLARYRGHGTPADVLLVNGFDRQDAWIGDGNNRRDQATVHAQAIDALPDRNVYYDTSSNEALLLGQVDPAAYRAVIWILGEESTADESFSDQEQALVQAYQSAGGALMASGSEIGWDLVERGAATDQTFFDQAFDTIYLADDAATCAAVGSGAFAALGPLAFDDGAAGIYPVEWPDVFEAASADAQVVIEYDDGQPAAVASTRYGRPSLIIGFPFETIVDEQARWALMDLALAFLLPGHTPDDYDGDGLPDAWEHAHDTDPTRPSADEDPDGDGATNLEEYQRGTDPQLADGQTDGGSDGEDGGATDGGDEDEHKSKGGCGCGRGGADSGAALPLAILALTWRRRRKAL